MKIINYQDLATTPLRQTGLNLVEAGLAAIDTKKVVTNSVRLAGDTLVVKDKRFDLKSYDDVYVVGIGKCAIDAAIALEQALGDKLKDGMVIDVRDSKETKKIRVFRGFHPRPHEANVDATKALIDFLEKRNEKDLVICVVSGGGSTLLCSPLDLSCQEEGLMLDHLMRSGVAIKEINVIRKHISFARGGHLAKYAYPATLVALIFSDVVGDELDVVASGPTFKDSTTVADAEKILMDYNVLKTCGVDHCGLIETPKDDKYFAKVTNIELVSNSLALDAMRAKAEAFGWQARIVTSKMQGEARQTGAAALAELAEAENKTVLLYGGESTVQVTGNGKGGRNQELALSCVNTVAKDQLIIAVGSDGRDNSDVAGALADSETRTHATEAGLDAAEFLERNDSYNFFEKTGDRIITGDTGSNVSDFLLALKN